MANSEQPGWQLAQLLRGPGMTYLAGRYLWVCNRPPAEYEVESGKPKLAVHMTNLVTDNAGAAGVVLMPANQLELVGDFAREVPNVNLEHWLATGRAAYSGERSDPR